MQGGDPYIPRSWGGGCTAAELYRNLRERGVSKFEAAQYIYTIIRTHPDAVTDPELSAPLEVIPHPDNETVTVMTGKLVLDGSEVRMSTKRPAEIELPNAPGRRDQWDWNEARTFARNLYLRAVAIGGPEPDIAAEVRLFLANKHVKDKDGNAAMPSDSSLYEHVRQWRAAGDYSTNR